MKFILENPAPPSEPLFNEVETEQFFVDDDGFLCQKVNPDAYNCIADANGYPCAWKTMTCNRDMPIMKILPKVLKIEF